MPEQPTHTPGAEPGSDGNKSLFSVEPTPAGGKPSQWLPRDPMDRLIVYLDAAVHDASPEQLRKVLKLIESAQRDIQTRLKAAIPEFTIETRQATLFYPGKELPDITATEFTLHISGNFTLGHLKKVWQWTDPDSNTELIIFLADSSSPPLDVEAPNFIRLFLIDEDYSSYDTKGLCLRSTENSEKGLPLCGVDRINAELLIHAQLHRAYRAGVRFDQEFSRTDAFTFCSLEENGRKITPQETMLLHGLRSGSVYAGASTGYYTIMPKSFKNQRPELLMLQLTET